MRNHVEVHPPTPDTERRHLTYDCDNSHIYGESGIEVTTRKKLLGHVQAKTFSKLEKRNQKKKSEDQIANIVLISFPPYYFRALTELGFPRKHFFKT